MLQERTVGMQQTIQKWASIQSVHESDEAGTQTPGATWFGDAGEDIRNEKRKSRSNIDHF
jgi:hypothetical protein